MRTQTPQKPGKDAPTSFWALTACGRRARLGSGGGGSRDARCQGQARGSLLGKAQLPRALATATGKADSQLPRTPPSLPPFGEPAPQGDQLRVLARLPHTTLASAHCSRHHPPCFRPRRPEGISRLFPSTAPEDGHPAPQPVPLVGYWHHGKPTGNQNISEHVRMRDKNMKRDQDENKQLF